jgi:hypothetical protein
MHTNTVESLNFMILITVLQSTPVLSFRLKVLNSVCMFFDTSIHAFSLLLISQKCHSSNHVYIKNITLV